MKSKHMTAILLLFLGCAGVVQASGNHGSYNGDPIVSVLSEGKELSVEDAPAVIRDGRAMVPLYLLRQAGVEVKWDPEKYNVDLMIPDPIQETIDKLKAFNAEAEPYGAGNVRLTYNEYGPYLQVDLKLSNDSNKDNEHIKALSTFLTDSSIGVLVVNIIHNDTLQRTVVVQRTDAVDFQNKNLSNYEFINKWKVIYGSGITDISVPNLPLEPEPEPTDPRGPGCTTIVYSYQEQVQSIVESFNQKNTNYDSKGLEQHLNDLKENVDAVLKEQNCIPL